MWTVGYCHVRGWQSGTGSQTGRRSPRPMFSTLSHCHTVHSKQFHVMRDGPFHITTILAGLWGANNYLNFSRALEVRDKLLNVQPNQWKFFDQKILNTRVWPAIRKLKSFFVFQKNVLSSGTFPLFMTPTTVTSGGRWDQRGPGRASGRDSCTVAVDQPK